VLLAVGIAASGTVGTARSARAGGFYVPEQGARAVAMGGAVVAAPGEVSGIFHNPASIAASPALQAEAGGLVVFPSFTFFRRPATDPFPASPDRATVYFDGAKNTNRVGAVPFLGVTSSLGVPNLGVGVGVYVPFGADLSFPVDGAQRNVVTSISLKSIYVTPTVAYRLFDRVSVGAGLSYVNSSFVLEQRNASPFVLGSPNDFPNPSADVEGDTRLDMSDSARFGASFGVLYADPDERFSIGASAMTPVKLDLRGTVHVTNRPDAIVAMNDAQGNPLPAGERTDNAALAVPLPAIGRLGVLVRPARPVAIELDVNYQAWSSTTRETIYFEHHYPLLPQPGAQMNDIVLERNYHDTVSVRLGAEVAPLESQPLKLRAGALFDQSPIDDRHFDLLTPDSDKWGVSAGAGYALKVGANASLGADLAYLHLFYADRDVGPSTIGTDPGFKQDVAGSTGTILNKPASSFFYGITKASIDILAVSLRFRI
jgi:long-chain fatty acid transport protein